MDKKETKQATIKWLNWHLDTLIQNDLGQKIPEEEREINTETYSEIKKCINWVKSIKV